MKILPLEIMQRLGQRLERLYGPARAPRLLDRLTLLAGRYGVGDEKVPSVPCWSQGDAFLITYGDIVRTPGEPPLVTLAEFLDHHLRGVISDVHILPFFPYSSDDGFSVIDYRKVNPSLGNWDNIQAIGKHYRLMFDLVLNHVSSESPWFNQYVNGVAPARDYFIEVERDTDLSTVVRPRTSPLLTPTQTPFGERFVWTTFSADQVDLNFSNPDVLFEFLDILMFYVRQGACTLRLDAIAYLWKRVGTPCIHLPETHEVVKFMRDVLEMLAPGVRILTETNVPHEENVSYFGAGDEAHMVYQFSLPPLLLHALLSGRTSYLRQWLRDLPPPRAGCTYLNFTASHDGIGVRPLEGLLTGEEIQELTDAVRHRGGHVSQRRNPDDSESPYELNITYFDALSQPGKPVNGAHMARFLTSQAVMLALQGIPALYFHSLTATRNDYVGVDRTGQARSINRYRWEQKELNHVLQDPASHHHKVFHEYVRMLRIRAQQAAFHPDAGQEVLDTPEGVLGILRETPDRTQRVLAFSNLTSKKQMVPLATLVEGNVEPVYAQFKPDPGEVLEDGILHLGAYKTAWIVDHPVTMPTPEDASGQP